MGREPNSRLKVLVSLIRISVIDGWFRSWLRIAQLFMMSTHLLLASKRGGAALNHVTDTGNGFTFLSPTRKWRPPSHREQENDPKRKPKTWWRAVRRRGERRVVASSHRRTCVCALCGRGLTANLRTWDFHSVREGRVSRKLHVKVG